jgi:agmatinase
MFDPDAAAADNAGIYGLPHSVEDARVVLLPVPWDATTSYRAGTANGPSAIFAASRQVDLFDVELGRVYEPGIAMLPVDSGLAREIMAWNTEARALAEPIIAKGGIAAMEKGGIAAMAKSGAADGELALERVNTLSGTLNDRVYAEASRWIERGRLVGVVGGDHSTPFGLIRAVAERHPGLGVLHLDAHADLREAYEGFSDSHASIMFNVLQRLPGVERLVQVGVRDLGEAEHAFARAHPQRVVQHPDATLARRRAAGETWAALCDEIVAALPDQVHLSFDIDGLDPSLCPHTGTPVPGGLSFNDVCTLLRALVESKRTVVGFDLDEVAPGPDPSDEWDANVGARLLYKMIGWTLRSTSRG